VLSTTALHDADFRGARSIWQCGSMGLLMAAR
jgi:hypothetical protein